MALGSIQPLRETDTRNLPGDKALPARRADCLGNVGSLTFHIPMGLHGLLRVYFKISVYTEY
jgi:hypothetical protein